MSPIPNYAIIIDAGSSGSRAYVYEFTIDTINSPNGLPKIKQIFNEKTKPGLSTFANKKKGSCDLWDDHFEDIIDDAKRVIPVNLHNVTPIFVQATAGMRLISTHERDRILKETCKVLSDKSDFIIKPCDEHVQVIDGDTEGLYGWLALNYLSNKLSNNADDHPYGFMDMGGASTQLAFVPTNKDQLDMHSDDMYAVNLRNNDGTLVNWSVFVSSWLGFGANEARVRQLSNLINALPSNINYDNDGDGKDDLVDPCSPVGMKTEVKLNNKIYSITGSGEYEGCLKTIYPLLLKHMPCKSEPCLFNGVHAPSFDFTKEKFVGVSEYWYTANDVFKLDNEYNYEDFEEATRKFCNTNWDEIYTQFENHEFKDALTLELLKTSCFKASWIVNVLHEGFGIPRLGIDVENIKDVTFKDEPIFKSVNSINGHELSWTLGKMILYTSSQIRGDGSAGVFPGSALDTNLKNINSNTNTGINDIESTSTNNTFLSFGILLLLFCFVYYLILRKFGTLKQFIRNVRGQVKKESLVELVDMEEGRSLSHQKSNDNFKSNLRTRSTMNLHDLPNHNINIDNTNNGISSPSLNLNPPSELFESNIHSPFGSPIASFEGLKHSFTFTSFRDPTLHHHNTINSNKLGSKYSQYKPNKFTPFKLGNESQQSIKSMD